MRPVSHSTKASKRFPLNGFKRSYTDRKDQEERQRLALVEYRERIARATGMDDVRSPLLGRFVDYLAMLRGFEAMWSIVEKHNGWSSAVLEECHGHADVKAAMQALDLVPITLETLVAAFRTPEFEAYRSDAEYLRCLAAEKQAHDVLPKVIADAIVREQRYMEGYRRSAALNEAIERANERALDERGALGDVNDLEAYLAEEFGGDDEDR